MIDSNEGGPFLLEADQGDSISGYMGRDEVADLILATLAAPEVSERVVSGGKRQGEGRPPRPIEHSYAVWTLSTNKAGWFREGYFLLELFQKCPI